MLFPGAWENFGYDRMRLDIFWFVLDLVFFKLFVSRRSSQVRLIGLDVSYG